jgi:hypothetical protein
LSILFSTLTKKSGIGAEVKEKGKNFVLRYFYLLVYTKFFTFDYKTISDILSGEKKDSFSPNDKGVFNVDKLIINVEIMSIYEFVSSAN